MKEKMKNILPFFKYTVVVLIILASLFLGHTFSVNAATTPHDGYGLANDYDTSTATSGVLLSGELSDQPLYYNCYYMHDVLCWSIPDSWKLFQDSGGTWVNFYWDSDPNTGYYLKNTWFRVNNNWFFAKSDGYLTKGWAFVPKLSNGPITDCGWFYFNENGVMQEGWQYINNRWYYLNLSDVEEDSGTIYEWGECLFETSAVPDLNTVADSGLSYHGKTARYVTGFTFYQNIYVEGDSGYYLDSSTPITVNLGANSSCSKTVEAPSKHGHYLNPYGSSAGSVTNSLVLVNGKNLSASFTKHDVNWYYNRSEYILHLNANGGTLPTIYDNVTLKYFTEAYYDIPWSNPTRNGYSFNGWWTSTSGGVQVYDANGRVKNEGTYWSNNKSIYPYEHTLYAQWSAKKYTVTYNTNGGTLISGNPTASVTYGGAVSLSPKATKDGMLFAGWGLSPTDTKPLSSYKMPANDVTLYALYSLPVSDMKEAVLVSWSRLNPAVYNSFPMAFTKTSNGDYTYSLSGINLRKGLSYSSDADILWAIVLKDNAGNRRVYGSPDPPDPEECLQTVKHYLWNIEANDWVFYASTSELAYENSTYIPQYLETVPEGYRTYTVDDTNYLKLVPDEYRKQPIHEAYKVTKETTTNAYYIPKDYKLNFNANGGNCDTPHKTVYQDYFYGELPVATRKGYEFLGWYTDPKSGTKIASSDRYQKSGDSMVYAHWKVDKHMVIYDYLTNGGNAVDVGFKETDYGSLIDLSVNAYKKDWDFVGWNVNPKETTVLNNSSSWHCKTCGETHTVSSMPAHDIVLYAIFKKDITVTIVEQTDSGTTERKLSATIYNTEISADFTITEETTWRGWELLGWTTEKNAEAQSSVGIDSIYTANENTTLYGVYSSEITVSYDTNGSSASFEEQKKECYYNASGTYLYPMFTLEKEPILSQHSFVGWEDGNGNVYAAEAEKEFTKDTLLTAKWDKHPEIEAYDRHFTLEEAVNGNVTETELLEKVTGTDLEDGTLVNGVDVVVKNYNPSDFTSLTAEKEIEITYQATDSFGNVVTKTVTITVTDTSMRKSAKKSYVRFISDRFFTHNDGNLVAASEGGLEETSTWRTDSSRFNLLQRTLHNSKINVEKKKISAFGGEWEVEVAGSGEWNKQEEIWVFKQEDIKELKNYTNTYGHVLNAIDRFFELFSSCKQME